MRPKKLVLSRKGFDSASGGCPSPIFEDNKMFSLPIPECSSRVAYRDLRHGGANIGELVDDLTGGRVRAEERAHLDPDINVHTIRARRRDWRGVFGTSRAAQGHLCAQGVAEGDVFLFFGLYRRVERAADRWRFVSEAPRLHVLWGWLQVEQVHEVGATIDERRRTRGRLRWADLHPHLSDGYTSSNNTLYIASEELDFGDGPIAKGAGVFPAYDQRLVLTQPGESASRWRLPAFFYPGYPDYPDYPDFLDEGLAALSYHGNPKRWSSHGEYASLQSVGRGQEFVLDLAGRPEATGWLSGLVRDLGES